MTGLTAEILTLGCRVNQYESDRMRRELSTLGLRAYTPAEGADAPDLVIINTCAVTATSERKSRKLIRKAARRRPGSYLVVTGCFAELEREVIQAIDGVDAVSSNDEKAALPGLLAAVMGAGATEQPPLLSGSPSEAGCSPRGGAFEVDAFYAGASAAEGPEADASRVRMFLKVQDGCDAFCTYCTVPYVRGLPRSRSIVECVAEARDLTASGARELVLTGVHLGRFDGLSDLIETLLHDIPENRLSRVRLSSIEVGEVDDRLLELMAQEPRLCSHLHLPLQSGSDRVLSAMGRPYSGGEFADAARRFAGRVPGLTITADVIAGFPGESEDDHARTMAIVESSGISDLHVFPFSARKQAPAASFSGQIPSKTKLARAAGLMALGGRLRRAHLERFIGRRVDVLVESVLPDGLGTGLTTGYERVAFPCPDALRAQTATVLIDEMRADLTLSGRRAEGGPDCHSPVL